MMTSKRVILGVLALGLLGTGCQPECVDQFDCLSAHGNPSPGKRYTCQAQRCEQVDLVAPEPGEADAGTDAGVDAGTDAGVDAGMDAGTDAGVTCADLPHDAKLGTLKLQTGFSVGESATLSGDIIAVTTSRRARPTRSTASMVWTGASTRWAPGRPSPRAPPRCNPSSRRRIARAPST